jgi:hypothetical protein
MQQSWGDWAGSFFKPKEQETLVSNPSGMASVDGVGGRRKKTRRGGKRKSRKIRRSRK